MSIGTAVAILASIGDIGSVIAACLLYVIRSESKGDIVRIDGRIDGHENGCEQRQKGIDQQLADIKHYVERMESKMDNLVQFVTQRPVDDRR